ncbi:MAG: mechanosensitive ion channel [Acidobacteria bacterium]|nr:mechanosensitive ion channel [Acidobacteriota bacterium]
MANTWLLVPVTLASLLALARLARLRPAFRPLLAPFALTSAAVVGWDLITGRPLPAEGWAALVFLVPLLILLVRVTVLAFQWLFERRNRQRAPALLESVVSVLLYGVGTGMIAHHWFGVELTPFLATSAVVGAVVGLALQETLGNLFSGIALHTESPFRVGDWVRIGDRDGRVEQVSWRAMRLRTWDGDTLTIPNNDVSRHAILNYSLPGSPHSRVLVMGVNYNTPPNTVISVLRSLLDEVKAVVQDPPPVVRVIGYADFVIQYEVRYFIRSYEDYRTAEGEVFRLIWYHFRRHGIEIPFPIRNVYLHPVEKAADAAPAGLSRLERALRAIDLFRPLSDDELRTAAASFRLLHYAAGEKIIEEGAPGDSFFVIDRGDVEVSKVIGGTRRPLARLMEGQFFGEMALLTGEQRSATVVAVTDVDVHTIDKAGFERILVANPAVTVDISTILAERREALSQATHDITARFEPAASSGELKQRILDRIRSYFGL